MFNYLQFFSSFIKIQEQSFWWIESTVLITNEIIVPTNTVLSESIGTIRLINSFQFYLFSSKSQKEYTASFQDLENDQKIKKVKRPIYKTEKQK